MIWDRKRFKEKAKKAFIKNYAYTVAVCFLVAFIAGESSSSVKIITKYDSTREQAANVVSQITKYTNRQAIIDWLNDIHIVQVKTDNIEETSQKGLYISLIEDLASNDTLLLRQYEANKAFVMNNKSYMAIGIGVGSLIILLFDLLIGNTLIVGKRRFFMENRIKNGYRTPIGTVLHCFKKGLYKKTVEVMFFRDLYTFLWMFTIIGGIIKYYEYRAIPYILADNLQLSRKEIFMLSKSIMKDYKWKSFVLDISFILWNILESVTFGIAGIFYVVPYIAATKTEAYMAIRNEAVTLNKPYSECLKNPLFDEDIDQYL